MSAVPAGVVNDPAIENCRLSRKKPLGEKHHCGEIISQAVDMNCQPLRRQMNDKSLNVYLKIRKYWPNIKKGQQANGELSGNVYVKLDKLKLITSFSYYIASLNFAIRTWKSFMSFIHVIHQMKLHLRCFPSVCKLMVTLSDICFHFLSVYYGQ